MGISNWFENDSDNRRIVVRFDCSALMKGENAQGVNPYGYLTELKTGGSGEGSELKALDDLKALKSGDTTPTDITDAVAIVNYLEVHTRLDFSGTPVQIMTLGYMVPANIAIHHQDALHERFRDSNPVSLKMESYVRCPVEDKIIDALFVSPMAGTDSELVKLCIAPKDHGNSPAIYSAPAGDKWVNFSVDFRTNSKFDLHYQLQNQVKKVLSIGTTTNKKS